MGTDLINGGWSKIIFGSYLTHPVRIGDRHDPWTGSNYPCKPTMIIFPCYIRISLPYIYIYIYIYIHIIFPSYHIPIKSYSYHVYYHSVSYSHDKSPFPFGNQTWLWRVFQPRLMTPEGFSMGRVGETLNFWLTASIATPGGVFFFFVSWITMWVCLKMLGIFPMK